MVPVDGMNETASNWVFAANAPPTKAVNGRVSVAPPPNATPFQYVLSVVCGYRTSRDVLFVALLVNFTIWAMFWTKFVPVMGAKELYSTPHACAQYEEAVLSVPEALILNCNVAPLVAELMLRRIR